MIKTAIVAMTLLGCDCDAKVCNYIGDTGPQWDTIAHCEAAMASRVVAHSDLAYPLVTAQCRSTATVAAVEPAPTIQPLSAAVAAVEEPGIGAHITDSAVATFKFTSGGYERLKLGAGTVGAGVWNGAASTLSTAAGWFGR